MIELGILVEREKEDIFFIFKFRELHNNFYKTENKDRQKKKRIEKF